MEGSVTIIVDAGVLYAALDRREKHHAWAAAALQTISSPLVTCDAVVSETCFLLQDFPRGVQRLAAWFETGHVRIAHESQHSSARAFELMEDYSDVPMSYADACLVCMAEARPRSRVFTLNSDFRIYRQRNRRVIPLIAPFVQA